MGAFVVIFVIGAAGSCTLIFARQLCNYLAREAESMPRFYRFFLPPEYYRSAFYLWLVRAIGAVGLLTAIAFAVINIAQCSSAR